MRRGREVRLEVPESPNELDADSETEGAGFTSGDRP